jgi:hypothetical protein
MPPRLLPVLYFAWAHLSLAAACVLLLMRPEEAAGFFYSPRLVAVVHLVTVGWITSSILGAIYIVGPMAMKMALPAGKLDYAAFACAVIGSNGMVSHFWLERYDGMAWSAGLLLLGILHVGVRVVRASIGARIQAAVKLHLALAFINLLSAGGAGILLGIDRSHQVLPGGGLSWVYAHAHLAALGWAVMMVMGAGYRLFPMVLPSAMAPEGGMWAGAILLQAGAAGLFATFALQRGGGWIFALLTLGAFAAFASRMIWMMRNKRRLPPGFPRPDLGTLQALSALAFGVAALLIGLALSLMPSSEASLRLAPVYGVLGLLGFLSQMVVGIGARLLPMFAAGHAVFDAPPGTQVIRPHQMPDRRLQAVTLAAWLAAVALLAAGMWLPSSAVIATGAGLLLTGVIAGGLNDWIVLQYAWRK